MIPRTIREKQLLPSNKDLHKLINAKITQISRDLATIDASNSGSVSTQQLSRVLQGYGITANIRQLCSTLNVDISSNMVNIEVFLSKFQDLAATSSDDLATTTLQNARAQLTALIQEKGVSSMRDEMLLFDQDGDGAITKEEFQKYLSKQGIVVEKGQLEDVIYDYGFRAMYPHKAPAVYAHKVGASVDTVIKHIKGGVPVPRAPVTAWGDDAIATTFTKEYDPILTQAPNTFSVLQPMLSNDLTTIVEQFRTFDVNNDNMLNSTEFQAFLHSFGLAIDPKTFQTLTKSFDLIPYGITAGDITYERLKSSFEVIETEEGLGLKCLVIKREPGETLLKNRDRRPKVKEIFKSLKSIEHQTERRSFSQSAPIDIKMASVDTGGNFPNNSTYNYESPNEQTDVGLSTGIAPRKLSKANPVEVARLQERILAKQSQLLRCFLSMDTDGADLVTVEDIKRGIDAFCFVISQPLLNAITGDLPRETSNKVNYIKFLHQFGATIASNELSGPLSVAKTLFQNKRDKYAPRTEATEIEAKVRESLLNESTYKHVLADCVKADFLKTGTISRAIVRRSLETHLTPMTDVAFTRLFLKIDHGHDCEVNYNLFLTEYARQHHVEHHQSPVRSRTPNTSSKIHIPDRVKTLLKKTPRTALVFVEDVHDLIKAVVTSNWMMLQKEFRRLDGDKSGCVDTVQVAPVLAKCNIVLSSDQLARLCKRWTTSANMFSYSSLLRLFLSETTYSTRHSPPKMSVLQGSETISKLLPAHITRLGKYAAIIRRDWKTLRQAFKKEESAVAKAGLKRSKGYVGYETFRLVLHSHGIELSDDVFMDVVGALDTGLKDCVHYDTFLKSCLKCIY